MITHEYDGKCPNGCPMCGTAEYPSTDSHTGLYVLFRAYRDVLVRIGEQGENFDRSEAVDVLSRIADSDHITDHQRLDMLRTVIRAAADMELDDESEQEIDVTTEFLK